MTADWRSWAITASLLILVAGVALWVATGHPGVAILGLVCIITSVAERSYGRLRLRPAADMRPTDERFVDPESGKLVTVWIDPATGERRYVADGARAD